MASKQGSTAVCKENWTKVTKGKSPQRQWSNKMVEDIIVCLKESKSQMDYKYVDFNIDAVALYLCYTRFVLCTYAREWLSSSTRSILASICHFHENNWKHSISDFQPSGSISWPKPDQGWINPPRMRGNPGSRKRKSFPTLGGEPLTSNTGSCKQGLSDSKSNILWLTLWIWILHLYGNTNGWVQPELNTKHLL